MADIRKYITVLGPAASNGNIQIEFKSINPTQANPLVDLTMTIPVFANQDEIDTATTIMNAIIAQLTSANLLYQGVPIFEQDGQGPYTFFKLIQCDNIINVWGQSQFRMKFTDIGGTGIAVSLDDIPLYLTMTEATDIGGANGSNFDTAADGSALTTAQKIQAIRSCSARILSYMSNEPFVASTFLHVERGWYMDGFTVMHTPVISYDPPIVRAPSLIGALGTSNQPITTNFELTDHADGVFTFTSWGFSPFINRPLDFDNVLKMTYIAGYASVPTVLKEQAAIIGRYLKMVRNVKQIKGADFAMTLITPKEMREDVQREITGALLM